MIQPCHSLAFLLSVLSCSFAITRAETASNRPLTVHQARADLLHRDITIWRGGASSRRKSSLREEEDEEEEEDPFGSVAKAIRDRLASSDNDDDNSRPPEISDIIDALHILSSSQQTFKGLDGAAHEAYQRTHAGDDVDITVSGRARRSAARAAATADGLGACELTELLEIPFLTSEFSSFSENNGTLAGRQVVLNLTAMDSPVLLDGTNVPVLVLFEPEYHGGGGILHGGIADDSKAASRANSKLKKGRLLMIVGDQLKRDLAKCLKILDKPPMHVRLSSGLVSNEIASVQPSLYKTAGSLLTAIEPTLRDYENRTVAIHFVGRSLAGGIANLAAIMLDGDLPMPKDKKTNKKSHKKNSRQSASSKTKHELNNDENNSSASDSLLPNSTNDEASNLTSFVPLAGLGKDRTSAVSLGAPPCVSPNVQSDFIIAIMYGDDVICRTSRDSLERLTKRSRKALKNKGWIGGKQLNFMSDAFSLTVSSLKTHAHGSEGEEMRLSVPGRAYLLRPRRLGGQCSIHEVGNRLKGGREALRAHVLWQLDDILLSKSLWKHHQLDAYIHGLDRAHLRGFNDDMEDGE